MRCEGATSGVVTRKTVAETAGRKSVEATGVGGKCVKASAATVKAAAASVKASSANMKTAAANVEAATAAVKSATATAAVKSATATAAVKSATATTAAVPATSAVAGGRAARNARRGYGNAGQECERDLRRHDTISLAYIHLYIRRRGFNLSASGRFSKTLIKFPQ